MSYIVALPDRDQKGSISAWTKHGIKPLKQALDEIGIELAKLPPSFIIGIPEPVLKMRNEESFVLSQVARIGDTVILATSSQAGKDKSDRHVFLTEIITEKSILALKEELDKSRDVPQNAFDKELEELLARMRKASFNDLVRLLNKAARIPRHTHLSSAELIGMHYQPDWPKKKLISGTLLGRTLLILLTAMIVVGVVAYERYASSN